MNLTRKSLLIHHRLKTSQNTLFVSHTHMKVSIDDHAFWRKLSALPDTLISLQKDMLHIVTPNWWKEKITEWECLTSSVLAVSRAHLPCMDKQHSKKEKAPMSQQPDHGRLFCHSPHGVFASPPLYTVTGSLWLFCRFTTNTFCPETVTAYT